MGQSQQTDGMSLNMPRAAVWTQQVVELPPIMQQRAVKHIVFESDEDEANDQYRNNQGGSNE